MDKLFNNYLASDGFKKAEDKFLDKASKKLDQFVDAHLQPFEALLVASFSLIATEMLVSLFQNGGSPAQMGAQFNFLMLAPPLLLVLAPYVYSEKSPLKSVRKALSFGGKLDGSKVAVSLLSGGVFYLLGLNPLYIIPASYLSMKLIHL